MTKLFCYEVHRNGLVTIVEAMVKEVERPIELYKIMFISVT